MARWTNKTETCFEHKSKLGDGMVYRCSSGGWWWCAWTPDGKAISGKKPVATINGAKSKAFSALKGKTNDHHAGSIGSIEVVVQAVEGHGP